MAPEDTKTAPTEDTQADGYYDDDMGSEELNLSFLDDESPEKK